MRERSVISLRPGHTERVRVRICGNAIGLRWQILMWRSNWMCIDVKAVPFWEIYAKNKRKRGCVFGVAGPLGLRFIQEFR